MDPVLDPVSEDPMARRESQRACQNADAPGRRGQLLALSRSAGRRRQHSGVLRDGSAASARLPLAGVHAVSVGTRWTRLAGRASTFTCILPEGSVPNLAPLMPRQ